MILCFNYKTICDTFQRLLNEEERRDISIVAIIFLTICLFMIFPPPIFPLSLSPSVLLKTFKSTEMEWERPIIIHTCLRFENRLGWRVLKKKLGWYFRCTSIPVLERPCNSLSTLHYYHRSRFCKEKQSLVSAYRRLIEHSSSGRPVRPASRLGRQLANTV